MTKEYDIELEGKEGKCKSCYKARLDALFGWSPCQNAGCAFHPKNHDGYFPQYQNREEMEKEFGPRKVEPTILVPKCYQKVKP